MKGQTMIPANAAVEASKPARGRAPRRPGEQAPKPAPARVAKSKDAGKTKVSFYLDAPVADKLAVAAVIRRVDQSDVANEILARALSSVTFYDRPTRAPEASVPVSEIGGEASSL